MWGETIFELVERNRVEEVQTELEAHPEWIEKKQHQVTLLHVASCIAARLFPELHRLPRRTIEWPEIRLPPR